MRFEGDELFIKNPTLVTNFSEGQRKFHEAAIAELNDPNFAIQGPVAPSTDGGSVHDLSGKRKQEYWDAFYRIKERMNVPT